LNHERERAESTDAASPERAGSLEQASALKKREREREKEGEGEGEEERKGTVRLISF